MCNMKYKVIIILLFGFRFSFCQSGIQLYGGLSICNTNQYTNEHQGVLGSPPGGPKHWLTFHGGIQKKIFNFKKIGLLSGLGFSYRGANNYTHVIWPVDTIVDLRMLYAQLPIILQFPLLNDKPLFFEIGITPSFILWQKKYFYTSQDPSYIEPTAHFFQLEYHCGIRVPIYNKISGKASFNRSVFEISKQGTNVEYLKPRSIHYSFDLSIFYKL